MPTQKDLIVQFSQAERLKTLIMDFMDLLHQYEDYSKAKNTEPDGMLVLNWVMNKMLRYVSLASNVCKIPNFQAAEQLVEAASTAFNSPTENFDPVITKLREALTKVTTEAARAAEPLF